MLGRGVAVLLALAGAGAGAAPVALHFGTGYRLGWGASRLASRQQSLAHLSPANACPGVDELYYSDAVVDNFASIAQQKKWAAPGQRYWTSSTHWGGPGFPVFVWIGGEGTEAWCAAAAAESAAATAARRLDRQFDAPLAVTASRMVPR